MGVPAITPVVDVNCKPLGSVPEVTCQVYGVTPPFAASAKEYVAPTVPDGTLVGVIVKLPEFAREVVTPLKLTNVKTTHTAAATQKGDLGDILFCGPAELD